MPRLQKLSLYLRRLHGEVLKCRVFCFPAGNVRSPLPPPPPLCSFISFVDFPARLTPAFGLPFLTVLGVIPEPPPLSRR